MLIRQREQQVASNYDANGSPVVPPSEMRRVDGNCPCNLCGRPYWRHPDTYEHLDWNGHPFLKVACDGSLVKL